MHGIRQLSDKSPCGPARGRALHGHILVTAWGYALITDCTPAASCPRTGCFTTWSADLKKNCCFWPSPSISMGGMGWRLFEACSASSRRQAPGGQVHSLHLKTSGAVERCWQLPEASRNWSVFARFRTKHWSWVAFKKAEKILQLCRLNQDVMKCPALCWGRPVRLRPQVKETEGKKPWRIPVCCNIYTLPIRESHLAVTVKGKCWSCDMQLSL